MDNLTHALTGAALSKAGLERATPLATATLVVAANAPDLDMLAYVGGPYFALAARRGITHGLPAMAVLPFAVAGAMLLWDRLVRRRRDPEALPARFLPLLGLSAVGLLTHPALDWMNTYGLRWLLPIDGAWSYGDALFIIDPWLWLLLAAAVFVPGRWSGRGYGGWGMLCAVASALVLLAPIGGGVKAAWGAGVAGTALWHVRSRWKGGTPGALRRSRALVVVAVAYVVTMVGLDVLARRDVRAAAAESDLDVADLMVAPSPGNPLRSEVEVVTRRGYVPGDHRWTRNPRARLRPEALVPHVTLDDATAPAEGERVLAAARAVPAARHYLTWSRYPWARVTRDGSGGWSVRFGDARYDERGGVGSLSGVAVHVGPHDLGG